MVWMKTWSCCGNRGHQRAMALAYALPWLNDGPLALHEAIKVEEL